MGIVICVFKVGIWSIRYEKFPELLDRIKKSLVTRVVSTRELLCACGECYDDLIRDTFQDENHARTELAKQLDHLEDNLDFAIEHDMMRLNSLIKKQTISILRNEMSYKRAEFDKEVQRVFNGI